MPDNISALYNELKNTYDVGSEDDFRQYLSNRENREALRKELSSEWDTGDEKSWNEYLGYSTGEDYSGYSQEVVDRYNSPDNKAGNYKDLSQIAGEVEAEKRAAADKGVVGNMVDSVRNILQENLAGGGAGIGNVVGKTVAAGQKKVATQPQAQQRGAAPMKNVAPVNSNMGEDLMKVYSDSLSRRSQGDMSDTPSGAVMKRLAEYGLPSDEQSKQIYAEIWNQHNYNAAVDIVNKNWRKFGEAMLKKGYAPQAVYKAEDFLSVPEVRKAIEQAVAGKDDITQERFVEHFLAPAMQSVMKEVYKENEDEVVKRSIDNSYQELRGKADEILERTKPQVPTSTYGQGYSAIGSALQSHSSGENPDYHRAKLASGVIEDCFDVINEAKLESHENQTEKDLKGTMRGLINGIFKQSTWDFGGTDMMTAQALNDAADAFERGDKLTDVQQLLLDAAALKTMVEQYYGEDLATMYKAGLSTAQSLPFMAEMALNPLSGLGNTLASKVARWGLKRFARNVTAHAAEKALAERLGTAVGKALFGTPTMRRLTAGVSRIAGDLVSTAFQTNTIGLGHLIADAKQRSAGTVMPTIKNDKVVVDKIENREDPVTAFLKAEGAQSIEVFSEHLGDIVPEVGTLLSRTAIGNAWRKGWGAAGRAVHRGAERAGLQKVEQFFRDIVDAGGYSSLGKMVSDFQKQAHWDGLIGEFGEEVAGGVMNAIVVGDQTLDTDERTGVFNLNNLGETLASVSLMSGAFSMVNTLGYKNAYKRAELQAEQANADNRKNFGVEWGAIRQRIDNAITARDAQALNDIVLEFSYKGDDTQYDEAQRRGVVSYIKAQYTLAGAEFAYRAREKEMGVEEDQPLDSEGQQMEDRAEQLRSEEAGYNTTDEEGMQDARNRMEMTRQKIKDRFLQAERFLNDIDADPIGTLSWATLSDEDKQVVVDYVNAKAVYDGMIQRVRDDIDMEVAQATAAIDNRVAPVSGGGDGMIHPATLKIDDRQVDIVGGRVVMTEDGTMVDATNSDKDIIIRDSETGKVEFVDVHDILTVGEVLDPEQLKSEQAQNITSQLQQEAADKIDGTLSFAQGDTYQLPDEEGNVHTLIVGEDQGDGTISVYMDGREEPEVVSKAWLQQMQDDKNRARVEEAEVAVEPEVQEGTDGETEISENYAQKTEDNIPVENIQPVGKGVFGNIYDQFKGKAKEAIAFLMQKKEGEAKGALHHKDVGDIDLVWGEVGTGRSDGFGLAKLVKYHPEVLDNLQEILDDMHVTKRSENRVLLESDTHQAAVRLTWNEQKKTWLLTAFEKKNSALDNTTDTGKTSNGGKRNDTATPQSTVSEGKDTGILSNEQGNSEKVATESPQTEQAEGVEGAEAPEPMPMRGAGENAEPDFYSVTPERGHRYLYDESGLPKKVSDNIVKANLAAADKEWSKQQEAIEKLENNPGTNPVKYQQKRKQLDEKQQAAQAAKDYWTAVREEQNKRDAAIVEERAAQDAAAREQAKADEEARQAEEIAKREEQEKLGSNNVSDVIKKKWQDAKKVEGFANEIPLPNGEKVKGRYMLVESGAATPSHNPNAEFVRNEGFPVDENGHTVNDRDYERDPDAQEITRRMGATYDSRALQSVPVVSADGIVLSGNGRTMAGELAAQNDTDGAYLDYLRQYSNLFGFTPEQIGEFTHPRVVFVPDNAMPYTTDTFAKFNERDTKGQSKTEKAVKMSKVVDDAVFGRITRAISGYDNINDFYNDAKATTEAVNELRKAGAIGQMDYAEMFDGDKLSNTGKDVLESVLIGKAFEGNPDVIRMMTKHKSIRQRVVSALAEITNNMQFGDDYALSNELSEAIKLTYDALEHGFKVGERVSPHARQQNLFTFDDGDTVADYTNATIMMLADVMNDAATDKGDKKVTLKKVMSLYNQRAQDSANGQTDIFSGGVKSEEEILKEVLNLLQNGAEKEKRTALKSAAEQRKSAATRPDGEDEGVQQDGAAGRRDTGSEDTGRSMTEGKMLWRTPKDATTASVEQQGLDYAQSLVTETATKGSGITPQSTSMPSSAGKGSEKSSTVQEKTEKGAESQISTREWNGHKVGDRYLSPNGDGETAEIIGFDYTHAGENGMPEVLLRGYDKDGNLLGTEAVPPLVFEENVRGLQKLEAEPNAVQTALAAAEQETNTEPTEAQKEAGNYKKGHVKIDGYDVTIENPKGSVRRGTDASGKQWEQQMQNTYGYIRGTEGVDGDHIDVFFSEDPSQGDVFVVDQVNKDGSFDEHKVMYGFPDIESARKAYLSNYEDGWQGLGAITPVSKEEFKKWIDSSHRKTKPFAEYSSVKPLGDTQLGEKPKTGQAERKTQGLEGYTDDEILLAVRGDIEMKLEDAGIDGVNIKDMAIHGSRKRGDARKDSDLDVVVEYDGNISEDGLFNILNEKPLEIEGIRVDINPITKGKSGTLEQYMERSRKYDAEQGVATESQQTGTTGAKVTKGEGGKAEKKEAGYSIEPTTYTNKKGKTTPMHLVTFGRELSKDEIRAGKELAKESRGWWDREKGGFMMRDDDSAKALAEALDNEEAVQDAQPLSVEDVAAATDSARKVATESQHTGQTEGQAGQQMASSEQEQPKQEKKEKSKWVDEEDAERFEELKRRMREKLRGQMNMGIDPEILAIGTEMAFYVIKHGAKKFRDFAKAMIDELGDTVRPYLKSFYNGARDLPELEDVEKELTPYDEVRTFDVKNFDKEGAKDMLATAEHVVKEQKAEREAKEATAKLKQERNEQRKETEQEVAANTEALASEAATVASEVESKLPSARSEREVNDLAKNIDEAIDKVNDQLALLGYYEAEPVESDFNEAYGYMRNAEKKAVKNVTELFKTLTKELGISDPVVYDTKGKKQKSVTANIAPAGGDVTMRFMLNRDKGVELYIDFMLEPDYENNRDNLVLKGIMFRPERNLPNGGRDYLRANNFFPVDVTVPRMLQGIRSVCQEWLPAEDYVATTQRIAAEKAGSKQEKPSKERKSKKKSESLQQQTIPDLFSGLFGEESNSLEPQNSNDHDTGRANRRGSVEVPQGESSQSGSANDGRLDTSLSERGHDGRGDSSVQGGAEQVRSSIEQSSGRLQGLSERERKPEPAPLAESERKNTHNNHAERGTDYAPKGTSARIEANIKAIETMQRLIESGEPATPEDMSVLRKFSGWGGLGAAFKEKVSSGDSGYNPRLRDDYQPANPINARLRELLSPEAYEAANMSRNTAYYTPAPIIDAMWDVARAMGFRGGNVLEGSAGIGKVLGLMPTDMSERSNIQAIEVDETTGNILKLLYPDAKVDVKGFEKTYIPNGSIDLAITNVPFGDILVKDDTGDKDLSKKFHSIHDFCIAKNVRKLKEGGIGIFISTSGTLDSPNSAKLRNWLVNEGNSDVVGAFRMHKDTFGGAGVTSDIIVVRKRVNGRKSANAIDVSGTLPIRTVKYNTGETKRGSSEEIVKDLALDVNKHFVEHPEDMAGEMAFAFEKGNTYRATSKALYPSPNINQEQRLSEWAQQFKDMDWDKAEERESQQVVYEDLGEDVKEGSMLLDSDGNLCLAQRGKAVPINVNANKVKGHTKAECFNAYKAIKDALADVLEYQTTHSDDSGLQQRLTKLNKAYDSFVKTYGHLNKNTSISFLRSDMDYPSIAALESVSETGDKSGKRIVTYGKTDIFSRRVVETESEPKPTTIKDGIIASIYLNGRVDVPYIAEQLNMSDSDVRQQIVESGLGFENPTTTEMEVSYEYLSGNVREKLRQAQENNTDGRYDANIKALERVIPMNIPAHLIEFTLGSSWVEPKLYEDFVKERTGLDVKLTNAGGTWIMSEPYYTNTEQNRAMGVISEKCDKTIYGHELIKAAITCKSISVTKTISTGYGSNKTTETIVDKEATMACANKIDEIRQDFKDWARGKMQGDPEMSERMERVYNELFNNSVPKEIPDEFVPEHFGGAATVVNGKPFKLRPHQAKAVIRATTQPLMLAHEVGTGKTYTLITTAMEMRRLGTARKPMIVVQNATVGQFVASAKALYPNAKILTLEDADRNAEGRRNFYAKIRYNDWDMIVVPQSVFERIPDSEERQIRFVEDKVEEKMMVLEKMREAADDDRDPVLRQAQRELDQLNDELNELKLALQERKAGGKTEKDEKREAKTRQNAMVKAQEMLDRETDDVANFDDMGIDALLIDEAHEYKHLGFATAMQRGVKGVDPSYSKKSQGVYLKTQAVLENKNGKNVVFATGTPISNTAAEIWTFMRYLMPADTMREYGIYYFDDFVRNFGNIQQMLEFATNGKYKENNRFAGYVNLPELVRIWASVADTVLTREAGGVSDKIPEMEGGKAQDIYLPQTKALRGVMKFVKDQLDDYEKMSGKEKKENSHIPLVMYGIAKAAAVDARLVLEDAADEPNSKTNEAVRQTLRSLEDTKEYNGTVAIFADNYQNKATGFNLYEDIRKKLIDAGVPEAQVVVMKSGMSIKKKLEIFDKVNRGEVRVIMGSTFTLGTGVNIQERLHTLIHVDAPNRPMDYTQRNGRILRQGNLHNEWGIPVRVLRFGVEDSLDVTAYQRLKTKGAIADSIMEGKKMMSNSMENRVLEEEQDLFGDITAQLSGSQYALLKNQVEKEVKKLEARKKQWEADQTYVHNQKPRLKALIKDSEERAKRNKEALAKVEAAKNDGITIGKMKFPSLDAMGDYIKDYNSKQREQQEQVRTAPGYQAEAKSDLTVSVGGFDFHIHRVITKEQKQEKGQLSLSFFSKTQMTYSCPKLGLEDVPVDGQRLKSALEDILGNVLSGDDFREKAEYAERAAERYKGELQQVEARDGKPFEYADELKQAKEKLAEYEELMKAEMAEKEAKYAEMDASVESAKGVQLSEEESDDVERFRDEEDDSIEAVNDKFNEELQQQIDGTLPKGHVYDMGTPGDILLSAGFPNVPIELSASHLSDKANAAHHPFGIGEMKDLVKALQSPIAVFAYGDKEKSQNVIVEIQHDGKNFVVGIHFNQQRHGAVVSDIRGLYPKENAEWLNWINQGKLLYADKEKIQTLIDKQRRTLAEVEYLDLNSVAKIIENFENPSIEDDIFAENGDLFREVEDAETIEQLEREPKVKVYRAMQLIDGELYPPMSAKVDGEMRKPTRLGVWEEAEERPDLVDANGYFKLDKGNKKSLKARYNPYIHTSRTMLNDQFSEAQNRDNLVVVEMEVPASELTSGYKAEKAKDSVGAKQWKAGVIQGQLSGTREVILSRWAKPVRIVPVEEVADHIVEELGGQVPVMPSNVVTPQQREALEARGIQFVETDNSGKIVEGDDAGKTWKSVYGKKRATGMREREGEDVATQSQQTGRQARNAGRSRSAAEERQRAEYAQRQWRRAHEVADEWVEKLDIGEETTVYDSIDDVPGAENFSKRKRKAKGWFDVKTGKIVIILGNHRSPADVLKTILHEAVSHYGLRKLFGKHFDNFLDNVYHFADFDIKMRISAKQAKLQQRGKNSKRSDEEWRRVATEEYLSELAESTDFENAEKRTWLGHWMHKIKELFFDMLHKLGLKNLGGGNTIRYEGAITDNELRYILWRSYKNMTEPGRYRNPFAVAENTAMEHKLKVGEFEERVATQSQQTRTERMDIPGEAGRAAEQGGATYVQMNNARAKNFSSYAAKYFVASTGDEFTFDEKGKILDAYNTIKDRDDSAIAMVETPYEYVMINKDVRELRQLMPQLAGDNPYVVVAKEHLDMVLPALIRSGYRVGIKTIEDGSVAREEGSDIEWHDDDEARYNMSDEANDFHTVINEMFDNADFDKAAHQRERYDLGKTPAWMKRIGISGDRFSLSFKNIKEHKGKDADHDLTREEWHQLPDALKKPFAVTRYNDANDRFRLYVNIMHNGHYVAVGVDVKRVNQGRNLPMLEVNSIKTVFAHHGEIGGGEKLITYDKKITPEQEALLRGLNFREYPTIQEFSAAKIANDSETASIEGRKNADEEKIQALIDQQRTILADVEYLDLDSAAKIIENFENPSIEGRKNADEELLFNDGEDEGVDAGEDDPDAEGYDAGKKTFEESITEGLVQLSQQNRDNVQLRINAMRNIGGNLAKLRQAMARQREYDRSTVDGIVRLAKMVIDSGFFKNLSIYDVKRLMGMVNRAAGKEDITRQANEVVDMLLQRQLKDLANILHDQLKVKGSKVNAKGVEVQGQLDIDGQRMVAAMKDAMGLDEKSIAQRLGDINDKMGSDDATIAANAAVEYQGVLLAKQYLDEIKASEIEEKNLRHELKESHETTSEHDRHTDSYRQYVASVQDAIRENRLERIAAYGRLIGNLGTGMKESVERAKAWREREQQRVNEIHHNANSDLQGVPTDEHRQLTWTERAANWDFVRFFMKPLATFDTLLRYFGSKSVDGKGYLWNRFMGGWTDANDKEWRSLRAAHKILDDKVSEIMGRKMRWSDLFAMERKMPTATVSFWDGGVEKYHELTQGNLLYIYMVNKMSDGRMKLRRMGIDEEDVEYITEKIDPRFIQLADWIQDVFLKEKRNEYNAVHERLFGASMAAIENYFPLKINDRSRGKEEDVEDYLSDEEIVGSTITGSIIKRVRNSVPLDVTGSDAFDVVLEHLQTMEHWAAFAELNRDLNALLSYKRFRNRVLNMSSARYGAGKTLWKNFKVSCAIASGVYRPKVTLDSIDATAVNVAKGVTAAKIAFRIYTAFKQLLSYPAYLSEAGIIDLVKSTNPIGAVRAWNWAIEQLPGFAERWQSRQAGDSRLRESDADWGLWKNKIVETASRWGMSPNAFVDGLTVAMGAKAIYETKLRRYKDDGYSDEEAKKLALRDASVSYNETQQSSGNAYLSAMQLDRTVASVALTVFRNASMGYQRRMFSALNNLKRKLKPGYRAESIEFMTKQMVRDGLDEDTAARAARHAYNRSWFRDIADTLIFGFVLQFAWNLGPYIPYLLLGDDDDEKDGMLEDASMHALAGGVEGLSGGNVMSDLYNLARSGEDISNYNFNLLPLMSDLQTTLRHFKEDEVMTANDIFNLLMQSSIGVNPQTFTDAYVAIMDAAEGDLSTGKEIAMMLMRLGQVPQTQLDNLYIDELGMSAKDAKGHSLEDLARRYATYKRRRNAPLTGILYDDIERAAAEDRHVKRFEKKVKERIASLSDEALGMNYDRSGSDLMLKKALGDEAAKRLGAKEDYYGKSKADYGEIYLRKRSYFDLAEDVLLQTEEAKAKAAGNDDRAKEVKSARSEINSIKKEFRDATSAQEIEDTMERLRQRRRELMQELGIVK